MGTRTGANSDAYQGELEDVQLSNQLYTSSRRRSDAGDDGPVLMKSAKVDQVYQIP